MHPTLAAMRRGPLGPALIALQTAITLAILSNALFIIHERMVSMARPSGVDESTLFAIHNQWSGEPDDLAARTQTDLAALRALPGVVDAYVTNSYPLSGFLYATEITLHPGDRPATHMAGMYFADTHTLRTLGLRLAAGRNFAPNDMQSFSGMFSSNQPPGGIIVSEELARLLAPDGQVIGRVATLASIGGLAAPIIGIIPELQIAGVHPPGFFHVHNGASMLLSYRYIDANSYYIVRAQSAAQLGTVMRAAAAKLYAISRLRVLRRVESLSDARLRQYRGDRGEAVMLAAVGAIMLAMTAWGIVGLTSCWVNQRRRQIGIRRALGATHAAIVRQFQAENLLLAGAGALVGIAFGVEGNLWMVSHFQMDRLDYRYVVLGAVIVVLLGQVATLWPALRAAAVPPAVAARAE